MYLDKLAADAVGMGELSEPSVFRRLRRARVVVAWNDRAREAVPVRGRDVWADVLAGRSAEFDGDSLLVVRVEGDDERRFLRFAARLSRL